MWSTQNIARVALMQVGSVMACIIVGAIYHRYGQTEGMHGFLPACINCWYHYGVFGFGLPIIWTACALYLCSHDNVSEFSRLFVCWLGVFVVIALASLVVISLLLPFMPVVHM